MTLRGLEIFIAVLDAGSMRAAAEKLYISQPSVSGAVADLEAEYGIRLFERLGKKLYITPDGEKLASYARRMLSLNDEIHRQLGSDATESPLRIGATVTVGTCVMPRLVQCLAGAPPYVYIDNTNHIEKKLLANALDIALVEGRVQSADLICTSAIQDELKLICPAQHPFAAQAAIPLARLSGQPMIFREKGSGTRLLLEETLTATKISVNVLWESNNTAAILNAVRDNLGFAVLSERLIAGESGLAAVPLAGTSMTRSFSLVWHKDKFVSARMQQFINCCIGKNQ